MILERSTDWLNQTNEQRAEACAEFLDTFGLIDVGQANRIKHAVRARGDMQRERK